MKLHLSLLFVLYTTSFSQDLNTSITEHTINDTNTSEESYVDAFHKRASNHVKHWSTYADDTLVDMADYLDNQERNSSETQEVLSEDELIKENISAVDQFFLNDKYLDGTNVDFISVRPDFTFNSKEDEDFRLKVSAHLSLSKSKKRFKLFINDLDQDNTNTIGSKDEEKQAPEIGFNYFAPDIKRIRSKYSLGIKGVYPFVRARYFAQYYPGTWVIEPIQTLTYSLKDDFKEKTEVYFDTKITDLSLFRLYLSRGTESREAGMAYSGYISYFWAPTKGTGLSFTQFFEASTDYEYTYDEDTEPVIYENMEGIYNYGTELSLRKNFYRKWLFYELRPGVNFHKLNNFEPNYSVRIFFDMFFGDIN